MEDKPGDELEKEFGQPADKTLLKDLSLIPRVWISQSTSSAHHFKGVQMYQTVRHTAGQIEKMRNKRDHPVLKALQHLLQSSIAAHQATYESLWIIQIFLSQVTDLLYGPKVQIKPGSKPQRDAPAYRSRAGSAEVRQKFEKLMADFEQQYKTHSPTCREFIRHLKNTYANWKTHLYSCYEHPLLPNDNNDLERFNSSLKSLHRRMTGKKNSRKFLLKYGEQAIFSIAYTNVPDQKFIELFENLDFEMVRQKEKQYKQQAKQRGKRMRILKNVEDYLEAMLDYW